MKWVKWIAIALGLIVVLLVIVGLALPTTYAVSRSVLIEAPRETVHALVADLEQWPKWEPWTHADPSVRVTLAEPTTGVGAHQKWTDQHGGGELTFTSVDPDTGIAYDLVFSEQYECIGQMVYAPMLADDGSESTLVTWAMTGDTGTPVIGGYVAQLMPGMIAPMFDDGLERLKTAAEADAGVGAETEPLVGSEAPAVTE